MKRLLSLLMGMMMLMAFHAVWADDMGQMSGMSTLGANAMPAATPAAKHKVKKTKKKMASMEKTYVCPMDGYTSDKPGKCPKCGMDLVEKK
jgi:hypothetical protein